MPYETDEADALRHGMAATKLLIEIILQYALARGIGFYVH